jgi:DNA-binding XRE family transcriptional regulator
VSADEASRVDQIRAELEREISRLEARLSELEREARVTRAQLEAARAAAGELKKAALRVTVEGMTSSHRAALSKAGLKGARDPLALAMARAGLSQVAVAEAAGVSHTLLSLIRSGKRQPSAAVAARLDEIVPGWRK